MADGIEIKDISQIECKYNLTRHIKERYAERIMTNKDLNYNLFIAEHEEKIKVDINKMILFGERLYSGLTDKNNKPVDIVLNGCWVVIVDEKSKNAITLYKIDLGLGDEFNRDYIRQIKERLIQLSEEEKQIVNNNQEKINNYKQEIETNEQQINELRNIVKKLESKNTSLKELIDLSSTDYEVKHNEIQQFVSKFIGFKG